MANLFGTAIGTTGEVVNVQGATLPALVNVPGLGLLRVAITGVGFAQDANVQFMHTLRRKIYVYSFGERMGNVHVDGVAFYRPCEGGVSSIKGIIDYYKRNSISNKSSPTSISLGGTGISGFVTGIRTTFSDPSRGVIGFSIIMASMPEMWGA